MRERKGFILRSSTATENGMVLLMVLAVLTLLCLLGLMFVMMANMERATARAYLDMVRTKMIAQSGIHAAMVNTRALLTEKGFDIEEMKYRGEDLNNDGVVTMGLEDYEDQDGDGILQTLDCPLYRAVRPSFMVNLNGDKDADGNDIFNEQDLITVNGKKVGLSGIMPGASGAASAGASGAASAGASGAASAGPYHQTMGAYYTVKVEDLSGKLYLNMPEHSYLKEMLVYLLTELFGPGKGKFLGLKLVKAVKEKKFNTIEEIRERLKLPDRDYELLKTVLTTRAWCDTSVINPVSHYDRIGGPASLGGDLFSWKLPRPKLIRFPRHLDPAGYPTGELVGRAPVNINTAPQAVLVALLRGLQGVYFDEDECFAWYSDVHSHLIGFRYYYDSGATSPSQSGSLGKFRFVPESIGADKRGFSGDKARQIARAIMANRSFDPDNPATNLQDYPWRGPFRSWQQFSQFCDQVLWLGRDPDTAIPQGFLTPQEADLLKANFNPNSNLTEFNPPYQRFFWVSKSNLKKWSTEFTFFPTGYFLITSMGRLLGSENEVLAEAEIAANVKLFGVYKETTQAEFLYEYWHDKKPIKNNIISENLEPNLQPTTDKLTLQTYPEIVRDPYSATGMIDLWQKYYLEGAPHYDGYICLATVENNRAQYGGRTPDFRASFNQKGLDADKGPVMNCDLLGPDINVLTCTKDQEKDNWFKPPQPSPGRLFPDGVYSELDSVPAYDYRPANLDRFTTSLWIKPHFFPEAGSKTRTWFTYQVYGGTGVYADNPILPLGIYSIPGGHEDCITSRGMSWPNASFFAGGVVVSPVSPWSECGGGIVSPCINHIPHQCRHAGTEDDPAHPSHATCGGKVTDPEGHEWGTLFRAGKWLHLGWVRHAADPANIPPENHGFVGNPDYNMDLLYINGWRCPPELSYSHRPLNSGFTNPWTAFENIQLRLGERRNQFGVGQNEVRLNGTPDGTIDEVLIWDGLTIDQGRNAVNEVWEDGRYYKGNDGVFTSRAISLDQYMGLPTGTPMTVFMVNWTQYVPYKLTPYEGAGVVDLQAKGATCEIEILDEDKNLIGERKSTTSLPDPGGELIVGAGLPSPYMGGSLTVTEPIRYRVRFLPNVDVNNDILVDPLIFDDITIIYYSVPKFLSWAYRR